jgi:F-type H+-transporting ATPase subunit delta
MGNATLAQRYATALFELADQAGVLDQVALDLRKLKKLLAAAGSADLHRLVRSPLFSREEQGRAMTAICHRIEASDLSTRFISLVVANRRLPSLENIIDAYLAALAERHMEVLAEVVSASTLSTDQISALTDGLKQVLGTKTRVLINTKIDPTLLGGMIIKVGSRMIDSSLRTKLHKLQLAMKGLS